MSFISLVISLLVGFSLNTADVPVSAATTTTPAVEHASKGTGISASVPEVPLYSQFSDISSPYWQKRGCGVASLAMLIDFYKNQPVSVDNLLKTGRNAGAYISGAGWAHHGLINLSKRYGLDGKTKSFAHLSDDAAFERLKDILENGPVIASVHYTFKPTNPIPHLAVINGVSGDSVYYNDPANPEPGKEISADNFMAAWKKRLIIIRPQ